jgi:hypothetical protein
MAAAHKWKPGQSGNPTGLRKDGQPRRKRKQKPPRGLNRKQLIELAQSYSEEALLTLVEHMRGKDKRMSVRAAQLIVERAHGAPPDRHETFSRTLPGDGVSEIELVFVKPRPQPDEEAPAYRVH